LSALKSLSIEANRPDSNVNELCKRAMLSLLNYCETNDWAGYEPYDASNSKIFTALPFLNTRLPRLILTQALKRSPVNIRPFLLIEKAQNPKALAIFLMAFLKFPKIGAPARDDLIERMIDRLIVLRSPGISDWCWGYSFSWQGRRVLTPIWAPNLVCTAFAANALLDVYEDRQDSRCLEMAVSAANYIFRQLYWTEGKLSGFAYPTPETHGTVHNANFLAAALLCRVGKYIGENRYLVPALQVARFSASMQHDDGGWFYGELPPQHWIDNFHTGYNIGELQSIARFAETTEFDLTIRRGFDFYRSHFFREDGAVGYYHNHFYPIDTHCVAQSIITLSTFKNFGTDNIPLAQSVLRWALKHMWDDRGFFYFRDLGMIKNRISYMRWTQSWMLLAMATLLAESDSAAVGAPIHRVNAASIRHGVESGEVRIS